MFSVIIPAPYLSTLILNNCRLLNPVSQVKQIILVNTSGLLLDVPPAIDKAEVIRYDDLNVYQSISKAIREEVIAKNVIILDTNIQIEPRFISKLITHYASNHLYTFKINDIFGENKVIVDSRIGNKMLPRMFTIAAVAFDKDKGIDAGLFDNGDMVHFAYEMSAMGANLKQLHQILCHRVVSDDSIIPIEPPVEREKKKKKRELTPEQIKQRFLNRMANNGKRSENFIKDEKYEMLKMGISYRPDPKRTFSIIIPFMMKGERFPIFEASIESLHDLIKDHPNIEVIIHETDTERRLNNSFLSKYNLKYHFSYWDKAFHRSWALNIPAKHIAKGDSLVFFDADLLVTENWLECLLRSNPNQYYIGWGAIKYLTRKNTEIYLKEGILNDDRVFFFNTLTNRKLDSKSGFHLGCGGINVIPRQMFFDIKGWPEDYGGLGYGGEDNSMNYKILEFGYKIKYFPVEIHHLYHDQTTKQSNDRFGIKELHRRWSKRDWINHLKKVGNDWGKIEKDMMKVYKDYLDIELLEKFKKSKEPLITLCMVNYRRYDCLLNVLNNYKKIGANVNLLLWVNDCEAMPQETLKEVTKACRENFASFEIILEKTNNGTSRARNFMLKKAYEEYDTPYIMTTDDDILFNDLDSLMVSAHVLAQDKFKDFGCVGIGCKPSYHVIRVINGKMHEIKPQYGLQEVHVMGAATMMIRKEVLKTCNTDPKYPKVGFVDWDFATNIRLNGGWKLGFLYEDHYKAFNDSKNHGDTYRNNRYDKPKLQEAYYRFVNKWNILPLMPQHWLTPNLIGDLKNTVGKEK